jgi:uncharacterized membrane protein
MLLLRRDCGLRTTGESTSALMLSLILDSRGFVVVLIALALPAVIGVTALGVEAGFWYALKRQDQTAADAAALSGAYERAAGQAYSDICALAKRDAAANNFPFQSYSCPTVRLAVQTHRQARCASTIRRCPAAAPATTKRSKSI